LNSDQSKLSGHFLAPWNTDKTSMRFSPRRYGTTSGVFVTTSSPVPAIRPGLRFRLLAEQVNEIQDSGYHRYSRALIVTRDVVADCFKLA